MQNDLTFFTNDEHDSILDRFKTTLKDVKYFDVLVGYFRTSGFYLLYEDLEEIDKIRILVGLNIDKRGYQIIETQRKQMSLELSYKEKKDNISNKIIDEMNITNDNYGVEKGIRKFIEFLNKEKLEIKFYPKDNIHAKLYIQRFAENDRDYGRIITGSSNFSYSGLKGNREFNVELKDRKDVEFALEKFEELWVEGIDISEEYLATVSNKTWLNDDITPYELYLKFLYEYFREELNDDYDIGSYLPDGFMELKYQEEAVKSARDILETYKGVFLADVVGLGKTFISALLAQQLVGRKLVVCPPALKDYWKDTFREFGVRGFRVESLGKLEHILRDYGVEHFDYIFVDEAHRFRNENTQRYEQLHQLCFGNKVILVSATPLNNKIDDIYSQLKLFQIPRKSDIPGLENLDNFFNKLNQRLNKYDKDDPEYDSVAKEIYQKVRDKILRYVMVRRTRTEIVNYYEEDIEKQGLSFPELVAPQKIIYEFDCRTNKIFKKTISKLSEIGYFRYMSLLHLKEPLSDFEKQSYVNIGGFMKTLVVKRLESSFYAFKKTISRFVLSYENFIEMYKEGTVYISKKVDVYELLAEDNEEELLRLVEDERVEKYEADEFKDDFLDGLENDLELLKEIENLWADLERDPKLECFIEELRKDELLRDNKLIIFTESTETGEYLYENLEQKFKNEVMFFCSKGGRFQGKGRSSSVAKDLIQESFDPNNKEQNNKIRLLITTDILAEGINLHRSNIIVNYDLPWNPTRVLQRVGRVNRVGTEYEQVYIYNFFPTEEANEQIDLETNIMDKIQAFHDVLGEDAKYLTDQEEVSTHGLFGRKLYQKLNSKENFQSDDEEEKSELKYKRLIEKIKENEPQLFNKIKKLPKKARSYRKFDELAEDKVITFFRKGRLKEFLLSGENTKEIDFLSATSFFECQAKAKREKEIDLEKFYSLLAKNKREFVQDKGEPNQSRGGKSNEEFVIESLAALANYDQFSNQEQEVLEIMLNSFKYGIVPDNVAKRIKDALGNVKSAEEMFAIYKTEFPESLLRKKHYQKSLEDAKKEIVLSAYLIGGNNDEDRGS